MKKTHFIHFIFWFLFSIIHWKLSESQDSFLFFTSYYCVMICYCIISFYGHGYLLSFFTINQNYKVISLIGISLGYVLLNSLFFELLVNIDTLVKREIGFEVQQNSISIQEILLNFTLFFFITICSSFYLLILEYFDKINKYNTLKIKTINNQINPHFINNELQNLCIFLEGNNKEDGLNYLEKLSSILNYNIIANNHEKILIKEEIFFLINYLDIISDQWSIHNKIDYCIKGDVKTEFKIVPLILIYFVENAIKHSGVVNHKTKVSVEIDIQEKGINLRVGNSLPERMKNTINSTKTGMKNAKTLLNFHYPSKFDLVIDDTENWYKINLLITLI
ncbi:MAG: histidine kinase [Flavobacteriales bacterium]